MLVSLILIILITLGGLAITYVIDREETLMWRLAVGNIAGSALFGVVGFVVACTIGFTTAPVAASLVVTMLPLLLFLRVDMRSRLRRDLQKARGKFDGANATKLATFAYYAFFLLLFFFYFGRVMWEAKDGIFTGGSQNLGDLPFHLGAIFSFTDGANFPPQNPSFAGAKFSYPFIADFLTAGFVRLGSNVADAIALQDMSWAMSLLIILERFTARLTGSKLAGKIAPLLLFFSGGIGFIWFLKHWWQGAATVSHLPHDYTINDEFRWGNSMVVLFITQRSLLLGMPLAVAALNGIWKIFTKEPSESTEDGKSAYSWPSYFVPLVLGLLAGTLPLIHLHSLGVLFVVTAFCFAMRPAQWKEWLIFGAGVAIVAVPELLWSISGTATETKNFIGFAWGWDKGDDYNIAYFWFKNTGLTIPLIIAGICLLVSRRGNDAKKDGTWTRSDLLIFYIPFAFLFVICNIAKFAPWEWDNIKILIYWLVGSLPLIAYFLAWLWAKKAVFRAVAATCFIGLIFAGALDVWRTVSGQVSIRIFDADGVGIANEIKAKTPPNALFLNNPTYNTPVALSGRISLMRYPGHLSSHGIDYVSREEDVKKIYAGGGVADILLRKYNVDYVLIGPEERDKMRANEAFFAHYPLAAEAGQYKVYKVK
ncbi:MAG TPA: hypothetical protein VGO43_01580 [Pyrinomonadaceae bacterium]|jgi:hypothetical protein|nr:hypothetical protein [Pyrinomonadaceae bacterium]